MRMRASTTRFTSDNIRQQILCKSALLNIVKNLSCSAFVKLDNLNSLLYRIAGNVAAFWPSMTRILSPLRRVVARELETHLPDPQNPRYRTSFLVDTLECGHVQDVYLWNGLQDVLFAYTDNPAIRAKRHRCQPCAQLENQRKPMQTVPAVAAAKTA